MAQARAAVRCAGCIVNLHAIAGGLRQLRYQSLTASALAACRSSAGIMAMIVLLCSAPISESVCSRRSSRPAAPPPRDSAASASVRAASRSPSALMMRARFSRIGFGFAGDGALHLLGDIEVFHFDRVHRDTPAADGASEHFHQTRVDLGALLQHLIQVALANGIAQPGFGGLDHRVLPLLHGNDDLCGVTGTEPQHGVDLYRD